MIEWITKETSQVAYYDQAEKIVLIPLTFITVLSTVMMPRIANEFANDNREKILQLLSKACRWSLFMAFPLMLGMSAIANDFIPWYLGNGFMATATAIIILSPIVLSNTLIGISGTQYFIATNQVRILLLSNGSAAIINVIINFILIPKYGYIGAAVATLISNYTLVIVQYFVLSKQVPVRKMFTGTMRYALSSCLMFVIIFILGVLYPSNVFTTMIQVMAGIVIYSGLMLVSKDELIYEIIGKIKNRMNEK